MAVNPHLHMGKQLYHSLDPTVDLGGISAAVGITKANHICPSVYCALHCGQGELLVAKIAVKKVLCIKDHLSVMFF